MALSHLGITQEIEDTGSDGLLASSTDASLSKQLCDLWYERCRKRSQEEWPFTFARKFALLVLVSDDTDELWSNEWRRAYTIPADCLKARRFVGDEGWAYWPWGQDPWHQWPYTTRDWAFVVRVHEGTSVILTDIEEACANLEYTENVTDAARFTEFYAEALSFLLASKLKTPMSNQTEESLQLLRAYNSMGAAAQASLLQQDRDREETDGEFLQARGIY
jgi:hypothetical protein